MDVAQVQICKSPNNFRVLQDQTIVGKSKLQKLHSKPKNQNNQHNRFIQSTKTVNWSNIIIPIVPMTA
jgi:hypothetical protein